MAPSHPNVLFLLSDEHTFRGLGRLDPTVAGEPVDTPTLDRLAGKSVTFEQAYCAAPLCLPSRLTLLTGLRADRCGAYGNPEMGNMTLDPDLPTLPGVLTRAGYETALVGKMHLDGNRQFVGFRRRPYGDLTGGIGHQPDPPTPDRDRGYASSVRRLRDAGVTRIPESQLQETTVVDESISFLRDHDQRNPDRPWFLCASFSRPHFPLTAPRRFLTRYWPDGVSEPKIRREGDTAHHPLTESVYDRRRLAEVDEETELKARAAYFAAISFLDEIIGDFLGTLRRDGLLENTIVVYASDHGELAGEHGLWWKQTWHEAATRVPLMLRLPPTGNEPPAASLATPVSLIDLFPTLCGLLDIDQPEGIDGVDLSHAIRTGSEPERGPVVSDNLNERWGAGTEFRLVRTDRYKYVYFRDAPDLLFDLSTDPLETVNRLEAEPAVADDHREFVTNTLDFAEIVRHRRADTQDDPTDRFEGQPGTSGNAYHMPDGRIVDADTPLYRPSILVERPADAIADYPGPPDGGG